MKPKHNIGNYLINELYRLNVRHIFGLPGDYILGFYDLLTRSNIAIINTCDEQGAGFAADAYARMRGIGAVCVTYCVGGLKVLNSTAEAYAEKSPVIIISGSPGISERKKSTLLHHKIRDYSTQFDLFSQVTIAATVIDDEQNAASEINRVLSAALRHKMPVYIEIPRDMIYKPVRDHDFTRSASIDPNIHAIKEAAREALTLLNSSSKPILVAGVEVQRFGLEGFVLEFLEKTNIPVVSTPLSKSVLNEDHPSYLGVYEGAIGHTDIRKYVESSDCIILLGTFITDIDFGNSPTPIDQRRTINSTSQRLVIKHHVYENISTREFIIALNNESSQLKKFSKVKFARKAFTRFQTVENQKITVNRMFQRLNAFISSKNVVIADIGDALFGGLDLLIHKGTEFLSPAYYLSMGFAIPGSIGAQLADPDIRPVVIVGDGAFQMTGVELSTVAKLNLNPIIILMNNDGFRTERTILDGVFNDIPQWNYGKITELLGRGKSYIVKTEGQFELALTEVEKNSKEFALIEVILDRFDSSEALNRLTKTLSANVK